jgi:hypothetical protein
MLDSLSLLTLQREPLIICGDKKSALASFEFKNLDNFFSGLNYIAIFGNHLELVCLYLTEVNQIVHEIGKDLGA